MAFSSYRTRFQGDLNNTSIEDLKELDYNKESLKDRLKYINEKYEKVRGFYNSYIFTKSIEEADNSIANLNNEDTTEYYKVNLNSSDELSSEINIFKYCEADANYLLNSREILRDKQQQYRILSEEEFKKMLAKEKSLTSMEASPQESDAVMDIMASKETNDYTNMEHKIVKKDFEHPKSGNVLREYEKLRVFLREEMAKCKNKNSSLPLYKIKSLLQAINDDMILSKIQLQGIRNPAKKLGDIGAQPDFDMIDYTNPKHVEQVVKLIRFGEIQPDSMLSHLSYDIKIAIDKLYQENKLDELDVEIVECFNAGYTLKAIGLELGRDSKTVRQRLDKIFKRIANFYKK